MSHRNIIRAWKDAHYRLAMSEAERALLPDNPAGVVEVTDMSIGGGCSGGADGNGTSTVDGHACC